MIQLNKIYNEDCLEGMKRIPDNSVDLVVTDPPYKVTKRGNKGFIKGGFMESDLYLKGKIFEHNDINFEQFFVQCFRVLKEKTHFYVMCNNTNLKMMIDIATKVGFKFIKTLIWNKGNKIMTTCYMSQYEYVLFFRKGNYKNINICSTPDILNYPNKKDKDNNGKNIHDTQKPIELMSILIENSTKENEIVLDPFVGSGTTAIACINTNRNFIGFELDENYHKIACERIEREFLNGE